MKSFWKIVNKIIHDADIILEVLDARFINETRNQEIDAKIKRKGKDLIYVLNKSDLVTERFEDIKPEFEPYIFVSAKKNLGTTQLRKKINELAQSKKLQGKKNILIGIMGYPNTGKSSVINVLKQRKAARTSPIPGHTVGIQRIKLATGLYIMDTPGVFPKLEEKDEEKRALINVKDPSKIKEPEFVAITIIEKAISKNPKALEELYKIKIQETSEETIEAIARKYNWLIKRGRPNIDLVSRKIISDWQRGILII